MWLCGMGLDMKLRNPNDAKRQGSSTSDFFVNGEGFEVKRTRSSNPKKIGTRINEKLARQGL